MRAAVLILALLVLAACGADGAPEPKPGSPAGQRQSGPASIGIDGRY